MAQQRKISVLLNGSVDEQSVSELAGPVPTQGASIVLRRSRNTRLSESKGTCARAPEALERGTLTHAIHGVVSSGVGRNVVAFSRPGQQNTRVLNASCQTTGTGAGILRSALDPTQPAAPYLPTQVTRAGAVPSVSAVAPPAVARDANGYMWHAYVANPTDGSTDLRIVVTVLDGEGSVLVAPAVVSTASSTPKKWVGVTSHGFDVRLWYATSAGVFMQNLALSGNVLTPGAAMNVASIGRLTDDFDVCSGAVFNADGSLDLTHSGFAYLATSDSVTPADGAVYRVDVATGAATKVTIAGAQTSYGRCGVCFSNTSSGYLVGVIFGDNGAHILATYSPTLVLSASSTAATAPDTVACQFIDTANDKALVGVVCNSSALVSSPGVISCDVYSMPFATSTGTFRRSLPWFVLRSRGAQIRYSATEAYPVFDFVRFYGLSATTPLAADYVHDPSVEMWLVGSLTGYAPVARYGVLRGNFSPARVAAFDNALPSQGCVAYGDRTYATYLKDVIETDDSAVVRNSGQTDYGARYVELDFAPHQPPVAHDKDGIAFVAAALPVQWDGAEVMEFGGPLHRPKLVMGTPVGGPGGWAIGSYIVAATYEWQDAAGWTHRSAPATAAFNLAATAFPVYNISIPNSFRDSAQQFPVDCVLWATETNGDTLHRLPERPPIVSDSVFVQLEPTPANVARQAIYSTGDTGEELVPSPPPPAWDAAIVGDRLWVLDAEIRSRVVYSKRRVAGVGYEFVPAFEILLPSGAGKTIAIREWQGSVIVFCESAIFEIAGDGPSNVLGGDGGAFSKPLQRASVGASSRDSVLVTPKGILFQRYNALMLFAGGEPASVGGFAPKEQTVGGALFRNHDEAVLFVDGESKVFNYSVGRWTTWGHTAVGVHPLSYAPGKVLLLAGSFDAPQLYLLDSDTPSTTAAMSWETDWLLGGGDFQDHVVLNRVLYSARRAGTHGVTVEVFENYNESTPTKTAVFSATEITNGAVNGRYTLSVGPKRADTRATKIRITETPPMATLPFEGGEGTVPICLTLLFSVENLVHEASVPRQLVK